MYIKYIYTLIKVETLVKDTFASWKDCQAYGNKLFKKAKLLRQGNKSWW